MPRIARQSFAFLIDMNRLFERFVHRLLEGALAALGLDVRYQRVVTSVIWDADAQKPYGRVIPDLLVEERRRRTGSPLPVDAKYKLYDDRSVSNQDIYQALLYAQAFCEGASPRPAAALLIHPSDRDELRRQRLRVRRTDGQVLAEIGVIGLPLPRVLEEVRDGVAAGPLTSRLAAMIAEAFATGNRPGDLPDWSVIPRPTPLASRGRATISDFPVVDKS